LYVWRPAEYPPKVDPLWTSPIDMEKVRRQKREKINFNWWAPNWCVLFSVKGIAFNFKH